MRYLPVVGLVLLTLTGCQSAYYNAMEKVGIHKRDIMVDRVEAAAESQEEAQEQFTSALDSLKALTHFDGGELEEMYNEVNSQYEASEDAVEDVQSRISAVEDVSDALFAEWEDELSLYKSATLRRDSAQKLKITKAHYESMLRAMKRAEAKMVPVLDTLRDNSLYLKHNLNAAAIGSLKGEFASLERDIQQAIRQMEAAIHESNRFIKTLKS
ncbi:DUF2959 domain-containing protein [Parasalinivibrio latis]|uniref:DUF2959 domain-containing protein n=1 Tax=Parasalinivibrio latis TaxID=2952610 RepID=UPI0030DEF158